MLLRTSLAAAAAACALLCAPAHAETTDVSGVKYENEVKLANTRLVLNGAGTRYKAIFKVYTAGLYLPVKASTPEMIYATSAPRRMHIVMLREINGSELGKLFTRGMEDNASREDFAKAIPGVIRMGEIFSTRKKLGAGEDFSIDWVPGVGTQISVDGKPVGEPIKEPEFFSSLMKIWLGKSPADAQLKEALLGRAAARGEHLAAGG